LQGLGASMVKYLSRHDLNTSQYVALIRLVDSNPAPGVHSVRVCAARGFRGYILRSVVIIASIRSCEKGRLLACSRRAISSFVSFIFSGFILGF